MSWHPTRDSGKLAAPVPDRGDLVERRHGRALGALAIWRSASGRWQPWPPAALRAAQPRRRQPRHLPWKEDSMRYRLLLLLSVVVACVSAIAVPAARPEVPLPARRHPDSRLPTARLATWACSSREYRLELRRQLSTLRRTIAEAAQPGRLLQRVGRSPSTSSFARHAPQPHTIPYVQIDPSLRHSLRHRRRRLRRLPALYADSVRDLRPRRGHRLRARDERSLVLMGIRARARPRPSWPHGGTSSPFPRRGRRQRHLAVDRQPADTPGHRAHRRLVAGAKLRHLGRH